MSSWPKCFFPSFRLSLIFSVLSTNAGVKPIPWHFDVVKSVHHHPVDNVILHRWRCLWSGTTLRAWAALSFPFFYWNQVRGSWDSVGRRLRPRPGASRWLLTRPLSAHSRFSGLHRSSPPLSVCLSVITFLPPSSPAPLLRPWVLGAVGSPPPSSPVTFASIVEEERQQEEALIRSREKPLALIQVMCWRVAVCIARGGRSHGIPPSCRPCLEAMANFYFFFTARLHTRAPLASSRQAWKMSSDDRSVSCCKSVNVEWASI